LFFLEKQVMDAQLVQGDNRKAEIRSARDALLFGLDAGGRSLRETVGDITEQEYWWEPLSPSERAPDRLLPPKLKRVWRVFEQEGVWTYDYTPEEVKPSPFTTIAWIMNHAAQTADMYLYCVLTGKPEGVELRWEDLPVPSGLEAMSRYLFEVLSRVREYLVSIPAAAILEELNKPTPAPWGEMRPTYRNIWGGIIEHVLQHSMQIAARKDTIRYGY
jgi:hypothetical protein